MCRVVIVIFCVCLFSPKGELSYISYSTEVHSEESSQEMDIPNFRRNDYEKGFIDDSMNTYMNVKRNETENVYGTMLKATASATYLPLFKDNNDSAEKFGSRRDIKYVLNETVFNATLLKTDKADEVLEQGNNDREEKFRSTSDVKYVFNDIVFNATLLKTDQADEVLKQTSNASAENLLRKNNRKNASEAINEPIIRSEAQLLSDSAEDIASDKEILTGAGIINLRGNEKIDSSNALIFSDSASDTDSKNFNGLKPNIFIDSAADNDNNIINEAIKVKVSNTSSENAASDKNNNTLLMPLRSKVNETTPTSKVQIDDSSEEYSSESTESGKDTLARALNETADVPVPVSRDIEEQLTLDEKAKRTKENTEEKRPVFIPTNKSIHTTKGPRIPKPTKFKPHKVQDDDRIRKFSTHIYKQALKAFESMKKTADPYTRTKIDDLAEAYKEKFTDFINNTRQADIKTKHGTQNVILHTIDTSNLLMERIVNFLKTDMFGDTNALRQGGASRLQKELDNVKALEYDHACKMFGICQSAQGFRNTLQNAISTLLLLPDVKLLRANDAFTEVLKYANLIAFTDSFSTRNRMKIGIKSLERADAVSLRRNLEQLYGVLSHSHLPLIVNLNDSKEKYSVQRTVYFHKLLDAIEDALPPNEANKMEWEAFSNSLKYFKDGGSSDVQGALQSFFNHVFDGVRNYGENSDKIRELVDKIADSVDD